jgi:hypothetical protein
MAVNPLLAEAVTIVLSLHKLETNSRKRRLGDLEKLLVSIWNKLTTIRESRETRDLFETREVSRTSYSNLHLYCCPRPPFPSMLVYSVPDAAVIDLILVSIRFFIHFHFYVPVQEIGAHFEQLEAEFERVGIIDNGSYDMCRIFAAAEETFGQDPGNGNLIPLFYVLVAAGFKCPNFVRPWLWHKLAHFEETGATFVELMRRKLAIYWGLPELSRERFSSLKDVPLENRREDVNADTIGRAASAAGQEDSKEFEGMESCTMDEF